MKQSPQLPTSKTEAANGLKNDKLQRRDGPHQQPHGQLTVFINAANNGFLNHRPQRFRLATPCSAR
jgi:hypothetical protein